MMEPTWGDVTVFLDFDGTVTAEDTCTHLLRRLGAPGWEAPGIDYRAGHIDGRTCLRREWALLPHDADLLLAVADEVPVDPDLPKFLNCLARDGAEVVVLSDGFGFFAEHVIAGRVPVVTNRLIDGRLEFPHPVGACACAGCGICKPAHVAAASSRGRLTVIIGDGTSDRAAAQVADLVFAKSELADWCTARKVRHYAFASLAGVLADLPAALAAARAMKGAPGENRGFRPVVRLPQVVRRLQRAMQHVRLLAGAHCQARSGTL
jgi:2-hydroxy-3-keto-5-methylthiopentenyl-1-phosphate phosphatase